MAEITKSRESFDQVMEVPLHLWRRFQEDRCLRVAASLSYTSLLALVPFAAIFFAMLSAFPVFEGVREQVQSFMFDNFAPSMGEAASQYFDGFLANTGKLTAVGIIGLGLTAILMLATIESALNVTFRVSALRGLAPRFLVYWALVTLGPLLLGASLSLSTYLFAMSNLVGIDLSGSIGGYLTRALPTLMVIIALSLVYLVIPNKPVKLRHAATGGLFAGVLFTILRTGFGEYVAGGSAYTTIYGAMAAVPVFLVWMYLTWSVVLVGAVLTAVLGESWAKREEESSTKSAVDRLNGALKIIEALYRGSEKGGGQTLGVLVNETGLHLGFAESLLYELQEVGYAEMTQDERWVLARQPHSATLYDLTVALNIFNPQVSDDDVATGDGEKLLALLKSAEECRKAELKMTLLTLLESKS